MDRSGRTLVILLSMHRSGSSFTTSVLHEMGMSLGPFELVGAQPHNVHGHFEAMPIVELSRAVQERVCGFPDELPETPETMSRFIESRGEWDETIEIPEDLISRGRSLLGTLIDSGEISGFKDPRTVLLWPFWRRVLVAFPLVRVAPIALLRSPHEIAMSLFTRRGGVAAYRTSLNLVAVHFLRIRAILEEWPGRIAKLCFGSDRFLEDLARVVQDLGMTWDPSKVERIYDGSCVHHVPATVTHEAQDIFDSFLAVETHRDDAGANQARLQADAMFREDLLQHGLARSRDYATHLNGQLDQTVRQLTESECLFQETRDVLRQKEESLEAARLALAKSEEHLQRSERDVLESLQALARTRDELTQTLARAAELRARLDRFEGHRVLSAALRVRRLLRRALQTLRSQTVAWDPRRH